MAIVAWPGLGIRSIRWTLDRPAQVNVSAYTGGRRVAADPWHGKWSAHVDLAAIVGEKNALALRAFLASCRGQVNSFRLPATEGTQKHLSGATVTTTAAAGASSMTISGCYLVPGHMLAVNDQLLQVTSSAPSGSNCLVGFEPKLRAQATAGTAVETGDPACLVALSSSSVAWGVDPGQVYSCALDVEEVF